MRLSSLVPLGCSIAAFVLSLLCLLAGNSKSFLQDVSLLTLNISRLGHGTLFEVNVTSGNGILNDIQGAINGLISDATSDIASLLDLPDFFNVHAMDYCQGEFSPNATAKNVHQNITECSNNTLGFNFQPTKIIEEHLIAGITLQDIHWPEDVQNAEKTLRVASRVMTIFYIVGIVFAGLGLLTALICLFTEGRLSVFFNFLVDVIAFLTIGVASGIATAIIVKAVNTVNEFTDQIGIAATKGTKFLAMTWAATAVMLLAAMFSIVQCCMGRRRGRRYREKERY